MAKKKIVQFKDLSYYDGKLKAKVNTDLGKKVDKVEGKDLSANDFTDELKNKLEGAPAAVTVAQGTPTAAGDLTPDASTGKVTITLPAKVSDLNNDSKFQTEEEVAAAINSKVASAYKAAGSKAAADLSSALLVAANEGNVYNLTTALKITSENKDLFVEGLEADSFPVGTNVGIVNVGTSETPSYKFDVLAGFVDTSAFLTDDNFEDVTESEIDALFPTA